MVAEVKNISEMYPGTFFLPYVPPILINDEFRASSFQFPLAGQVLKFEHQTKQTSSYSNVNGKLSRAVISVCNC